MSTLPYECDVCENPRHSAQVRVCELCREAKKLAFIGYCCLTKHNKEEHGGESKTTPVRPPGGGTAEVQDWGAS